MSHDRMPQWLAPRPKLHAVIGERSRTGQAMQPSNVRPSQSSSRVRQLRTRPSCGEKNDAPALPANGQRTRGSTICRSCGSVAAGMKGR